MYLHVQHGSKFAKDILFNRVVGLEEKSQVEEVNSSIHVKSSVINPPKVEIPHVYENCENWISFKELFKSSILNNKSKSDFETLEYLQASVRGDAAELIRGFAITVDNLVGIYCAVALINVKSKHDQQITCHALMDNASQNSLISKQCADRLTLPLKRTNHKLVGVNKTFAETSLYSENFEFSSCVSSDKIQVKALLVSKVTSAMPNFPIKYHEWFHIKDLTLADPAFYIENEIDILLGADVFMTVISGTAIMGPKGTPSALPTKLGLFLSDTINTQYSQNSSLICHTHLNIDHSLKQFWELEFVPKDIPSKDEDELWESIFVMLMVDIF
ncbi:gag-pol protein [Trichonephila clavipes]|nr:gag-pol protein [Trichonephila clavipes]